MEGNIQTADRETQPQCSTGITEQREVCIQYSSRFGALTSSKKWQVFEESSELETQLGGLMSLISEQIQRSLVVRGKLPEKSSQAPLDHSGEIESGDHTDTDQPPTDTSGNTTGENEQEQIFEKNSEHNVSESYDQLDISQQLSHSEIDINAVIKEFECVLSESRAAKTQIKLDMLLNIADIGGQPAFLEMLPSLTIGPALYLVFMNLLKGLDTRYPVMFKCKDSGQQVLCQNYTYTSEEVIFTALSSIASFGNLDKEVEMYVLK